VEVGTGIIVELVFVVPEGTDFLVSTVPVCIVPSTAPVNNVAVVTGTTAGAGAVAGAGAGGAVVESKIVCVPGATVAGATVGAAGFVASAAFAAAGADGAGVGDIGFPFRTLSRFCEAVPTISIVRTVLLRREPMPSTVLVRESLGMENRTGAGAGAGVGSLGVGVGLGGGVAAAAGVGTASLLA
jgi:hypothetical protein